MKVLFIDGPLAGDLRGIAEHERNDIVIPIPPKVTVDSYDSEIELITKRYYVHQFQLCGYRINIASIHSVTDAIDPRDVFDNIVSAKAREATLT